YQYNDDGTATIYKTVTIATFSGEEGKEGELQAATQQTTKYNLTKDGNTEVSTSGGRQLGYWQVRDIFGHKYFDKMKDEAISGMNHFVWEVNKDVKAHPVKYILDGVSLLVPLIEMPKAVHATIAVIDSIKSMYEIRKEVKEIREGRHE